MFLHYNFWIKSISCLTKHHILVRNYTRSRIRYQTFAFKGQYFYELDDYGVKPGFPKKISQRWRGMPSNINAAVYSPDTGKTYFFKGWSKDFVTF